MVIKELSGTIAVFLASVWLLYRSPVHLLQLKSVCICILVGKLVGSPSVAFNAGGGCVGRPPLSWPLQMPHKACHEYIEAVCLHVYIGEVRTDDGHTILSYVSYRTHKALGYKEIQLCRYEVYTCIYTYMLITCSTCCCKSITSIAHTTTIHLTY